MRIAIVGTAGRREAFAQLSAELYLAAFAHVCELISAVPYAERDVQSGGAAWMDHLAVGVFLEGHAPRLRLFFPAPWIQGKGFASDEAGQIANHYHHRFAQKLAGDPQSSFRGLQNALDRGAVASDHAGFHARNLHVGEADWVIALTFGRTVPQSGGTRHCWDNSRATRKTHVSLHDLSPIRVLPAWLDRPRAARLVGLS